jgi:predicted dithiol-disulfide oxidoreductase (DUF899 family)
MDNLRAFKRRMGWVIPWISDADSGFAFDYGFSSTPEQTREWLVPMLESGMAPPTRLSPVGRRSHRSSLRSSGLP